MGKSVSRPHPELTDLTSLHCFSALLSNSEKRCETACWALVVVLDGKKASMTSVTGLLSTSVLRKACFVKPGVNTSPNFFVASPPNLIRLSVSIHSPISNSIFSSRLLSHSGKNYYSLRWWERCFWDSSQRRARDNAITMRMHIKAP